MEYQIVIEPRAEKFLRTVPNKDFLKLKEHILSLAANPHPQGSIKMHGFKNVYRLGYGNYRIIYRIENNLLVVYILEIGDRKDVYKKL